MKPIRVGLIRCDLHAYWYAPFFAEHDPALFREPWPCNHWIFYGSYWDQPNKLMIPTVPGFELARVWDAERQRAETMSRVFLGKPKVCGRVEEVYENVDLVFIADCFGEGQDHLALAAPALRKGIPTFVDKPFAYTLKDALAMVDLAAKHGTPLMSASLLGMSPHADRFRNRFAEIEPVHLGIVRGAVGENGHLAAIFHVIALCQNLFGDGVEWVECMGQRPLEFVRMHYPDAAGVKGPDVLAISNYVDGMHLHCGYHAEVYGKTGVINSPFIDDFAFPYSGERILKMVKQMVETRKPPLRYESMLEPVRLIEAARAAQKRGGKVALSEFQID